jgi:hypothetical protein
MTLPGGGYEQDQNAMRSNSLMTISAVAYRLHHRQPYFIEEFKCNCKKTPLLDEIGHHISTACGQGGHQIMTRDSVKFCIKDLLNSCGIKTRVEVENVSEWPSQITISAQT